MDENQAAAPSPKKKRPSFLSLPSLSTTLSIVFILYIINSVWNIYKIYNPSRCPLSEKKCIKPSWSESTRFQMSVFVASGRDDVVKLLTNVWSADDIDISRSFDIDLNVTLPKATMNNGSLHLHVFVKPTDGRGSLESPTQFKTEMTSISSAPLTKPLVPKTEAINLLDAKSGGDDGRSKARAQVEEKLVTHWIPHMLIHCTSESMRLYQVPQEMAPHFRFNKRGNYLPILHIDHFGVLEKDFLEVNKSTPVMPLKLSYVPIPLGKMRLILILEQSLQMFQSVGFSDKEMDDIKSIFFDTHIYLLFLTFVVSGFHLLFDALAFKNDISFWRHRETIAGLSFRSLVWRCISQGIVFIYLKDQHTSLLVLVPQGVSVVIEIWKVSKALKLKVYWVGWRPKFELGAVTEEEKRSDEYDSQGMKYLMRLVGPCCFAYAAYSLLFSKHVSWYSWFLESVVNGVYAFGFIFMMPQLFINYKLKSVAHLPWKVFMYKAFNTIVDDLFAFIISMPTAHRIACFRDDIVFVIYLYQRWLYPVDKTRVTEYYAGDATDDKTKKD